MQQGRRRICLHTVLGSVSQRPEPLGDFQGLRKQKKSCRKPGKSMQGQNQFATPFAGPSTNKNVGHSVQKLLRILATAKQ